MNQVLAPYILGERLTRIDTAATGIIVVGIVLSTAFGVHSSANYTIEKLLSLWSINLRTCLCTCARSTFCRASVDHIVACRGHRYLRYVLCGRGGNPGIFDNQMPQSRLARAQWRPAVHEAWLRLVSATRLHSLTAFAV